MRMKLFVPCVCMVLYCLNGAFAQSDTARWDKYLFIKTSSGENGYGKFVYEYQDTLGNIIIPQGKYGRLELPDELGYIKASRKYSSSENIENNVGFIDIHENILIPFLFSGIASFNRNLAWAERNNIIVYINRKGDVVIDSLSNTYYQFENADIALANRITGTYKSTFEDTTTIHFITKTIVVDTLGNEIIGINHPFQSIEANFSSSKFIRVRKNDKYAFLDLKAKELTPFIFDKIYPVNICTYQPKTWNCEVLRWFYKGLCLVEKDEQFAVLNEKMEYVIPWQKYQWISPMNMSGVMIVKKNNKYGLLNHELNVVQPIEFDTISNYPARDQEQSFPSFWARKDNKYLIFDTLGLWTDKIEYDELKILEANFYLVTKNGEKWRVDRNGTPIFEDFVVVRDDENGYVARKDSLFGLINIEGDEILPFEYEDIISDRLGNIFVKKNGKWGMVNAMNQPLLPCNFDYIAYAWDESGKDTGNYIVVQNDKFGKISITGKEVFPCIYDGITTWVEYVDYGHYIMIDNKMGLIDYNGNTLMPPLYERFAYLFGKKWAIVYEKDKVGLYDVNTNTILLPIEFDYLDVVGFNSDSILRIITYKNGTVNILDEKGNIVQSNASKTEIKSEFQVDIDSNQHSICSYELLMMIHNRTYKAPDCLLKTLKQSNISAESIYYKMRVDI